MTPFRKPLTIESVACPAAWSGTQLASTRLTPSNQIAQAQTFTEGTLGHYFEHPRTGTTDTVETPTTPENTAAAPDAGAEHEHAGHDHTHQHRRPTFNPEVTRSVEVTIPADEVSRAMRSTVKRYQKQARIPGFRAGKVPESLIRGRFNERIRQEVLEAVMPQHFQKAITEGNFRLVSQPQVVDMKMEDDQPLWFKASFEVMPEFSVDGYQDVKVEKPSAAFTDEEFAAEVERVRDSRSTMEPVEEESSAGGW